MQTGQEARRSQKGLDITGEGALCFVQLVMPVATTLTLDFPRPRAAVAAEGNGLGTDRNGRQVIVQGVPAICGGMCIASSVFRC